MPHEIHGYTFGSESLPRSPITLEEFELLKKTVLMTDEDIQHLKLSYEVLEDQVEAVLDVWYGFVASHPHLLAYFSRKTDRQPDGDYLMAVRRRFGQWILDTASANYDQAWLNYQHEIGRRHHRTGKNQTDRSAAADHIHYRYVLALFYPITATLKPFLEKKEHSPVLVEKMHQAWMKSVLLQMILWSQVYVREGDF